MRFYTAACGGRTTANRQKLEEEKRKLVMKVNFLTVKTVRQWRRLLGESTQAFFKTHSKIAIPHQSVGSATGKSGVNTGGQPCGKCWCLVRKWLPTGRSTAT